MTALPLGLPWSLVIPVKRLAVAKSRLDLPAGPTRQELALAFAEDVVRACASCPIVAEVVVVTDDPLARDRLGVLGARVVGDRPNAGLNPALDHGAACARAGAPVAAVSADLPAVRPEELRRALDAAAAWPRSFVCDVSGTGTTLLAAAPGQPLVPRFGPRSRAAHAASGAVELAIDGLAGLRRDVDTAVDLWDAIRLGVGPSTAALLRPGRSTQRAHP